ncbi:hypothetical protein KFK09_019223 [Dendrobium nobile]|uniref:Uncharacterized protein n=1 Tax=Dendrobium nobile TaxID=94219 RepID=A0A8T3B3E5_DENNO|nr:hypothetical protein KFK09_019223 [Dendrobium nobile]
MLGAVASPETTPLAAGVAGDSCLYTLEPANRTGYCDPSRMPVPELLLDLPKKLSEQRMVKVYHWHNVTLWLRVHYPLLPAAYVHHQMSLRRPLLSFAADDQLRFLEPVLQRSDPPR